MINREQEKLLILEAQRGSLRAFEGILSAYEKDIYRYVYRFFGNRADSEDVTQDTFLKLYKYLSSVDGNKSLRPLVFEIATNTVYDFLRRKKRQPAVSFEVEEGYETIEDPGAYSILEGVESRVDIARALDKIRPIYKSVLLLYYAEDMSYQEVAEVLTVPVNTVKTYLFRAKEALKKELT